MSNVEINRKPLCKIDKKNKRLTLLATGETIPLRDLSVPIAFHVTDKNLKQGIARDPCRCAISRAIQHSVNAELVVTLAKFVLYVVKEGDRRVAYRGVHSTSSRAIVEANDLGAIDAAPSGQFIIRAPNVASSLKNTAKYNRQQKSIRKTKTGADRTEAQKRSGKRTVIVGLRSGSGLRQF